MIDINRAELWKTLLLSLRERPEKRCYKVPDDEVIHGCEVVA